MLVLIKLVAMVIEFILIYLITDLIFRDEDDDNNNNPNY